MNLNRILYWSILIIYGLLCICALTDFKFRYTFPILASIQVILTLTLLDRKSKEANNAQHQ